MTTFETMSKEITENKGPSIISEIFAKYCVSEALVEIRKEYDKMIAEQQKDKK